MNDAEFIAACLQDERLQPLLLQARLRNLPTMIRAARNDALANIGQELRRLDLDRTERARLLADLLAGDPDSALANSLDDEDRTHFAARIEKELRPFMERQQLRWRAIFGIIS